MRLTEVQLVIRPRSAYEAIDLGVLLARRHARLLMSSWALLTVPIFILLSLIFWNHPAIAMLVFWWLKPLYERLPLAILSRALFAEHITLRQALRSWPALARPQLLASLTWRRFSPTRSFTLPVQQLELLQGPARTQRLIDLHQQGNRAASWLTLLGMHIELALYLGLISLIYLMIPQQLSLDIDWLKIISPEDQVLIGLAHLSNLLYALVLVFWEPIYVACGFTLYLNRRTVLEAWDIELDFRRLAERLASHCTLVLLLLSLTSFAPSQSALAAEAVDELSPQAPRLLNQPLTSTQAQDSIKALLDRPPFSHKEQVTRWRLRDNSKEQPKTVDSGLGLKMLKLIQSLQGLAQVLEVLLWGLVLGALAWLSWRYRQWLKTFVAHLPLISKTKPSPPAQLFGLELAPESLPADIPGQAQLLWAEQPRAALSLLYRGLLSHLVHERKVPLTSAHTEGQVLALIQALEQETLSHFSQQLTQHWQNLAYGHQMPPDTACQELCEGWRTLFAQGTQP